MTQTRHPSTTASITKTHGHVTMMQIFIKEG